MIQAPRLRRFAAIGAVSAAALALGVGTAVALPADYDPTFSGDGWTAINSGGQEAAYGTAIQADGKIVVVGKTSVGGNGAVYRLNRDGSFDPNFDGDGAVGLDSGGVEVANAVAIQPDGKIVVVGSTSVGLNAVVYRLNPDGSFDRSFDGDGAVGIDSGHQEVATDVAIQPDGKIVVVGWTTVGENATVYRLNPNGSLDASFDGDGALGLDAGGREVARGVALRNGKIVVAGATSTSYDAMLWRLNADGSRDTSFDFDGAVRLDSGVQEELYDVAIQPDGKIVGTGFTSSGDGSAMVYRVRANGTRDTGFDGDGEARLDAGGFEGGVGLALQPNGKILVTGYTLVAFDTAYGHIWRLKRNGTIDFGFAHGSRVLAVGAMNVAYGVAQQRDGKIVVVGSNAGDQDAIVLRLKGNR